MRRHHSSIFLNAFNPYEKGHKDSYRLLAREFALALSRLPHFMMVPQRLSMG